MMTVKDYREMKDILNKAKDDPMHSQVTKYLDLYVKGVGDGFVWANALLQATDRERLFCTPEKLGLNSQTLQQILESYLSTFNSKWSLAFENMEICGRRADRLCPHGSSPYRRLPMQCSSKARYDTVVRPPLKGESAQYVSTGSELRG